MSKWNTITYHNPEFNLTLTFHTSMCVPKPSMRNASSQQVRTLQVPSFVDCMESMVYERKQVSKGDDPRTIWGSSDESVDDNSVMDDDYEPSGTGSDAGEIPENYAKVTQ